MHFNGRDASAREGTPGSFEDAIGAMIERIVEQKLAELAVAASRYVTKDRLADHFGVTRRTIKTWRSKGLPGHKVGREVFFCVPEAEKWIESHG
jgi:hypothetical protein